MSTKLIKLISTFFYVGDIPVASGSIASLLGVLIYLIAGYHTGIYLLLIFLVSALGFLVSGKMEILTKQKDPSCVVIDEVAGCMIAFFMLPVNWAVLITAYFLFRAFDMFKIYPANKLEEKAGSVGIMMDDIVAGLYTNIVMHISIRIVGLV